MKGLIEIYINGGFGNNLEMNTIEKGNKIKGGNKNALQSGRDRYTAKNYITI